MADDRSVFSGDDGDFMSCDSREYRTALGSAMEDVPQGQPGSNLQNPWYPIPYQGDAHPMVPHENFFDGRSPGGVSYESFDEMEERRPMYGTAPFQRGTAQRTDHVLLPDPPTVTVEDWDEGQKDDFGLGHYQHGGMNAELSVYQPASDELSMFYPSSEPGFQEFDEQFFEYSGYSTAPWTHLSVEGGTSLATEVQHMNTGDSSREPSAGMPNGSGRSSPLDGADNGTSYTSAEPYEQNMTDSTMTERPPLTAQDMSYMAQWSDSPTDMISAHVTSLRERTARIPVATGSEWSTINEYRASSSSCNPRSPVTSATRRGTRAISPALSTTPPEVPRSLRCNVAQCSLVFTGNHQRGSLHRHIRLKHRGQQYSCEICGAVYQRQDARLKHYRKKHNEVLHPPVAVPRK